MLKEWFGGNNIMNVLFLFISLPNLSEINVFTGLIKEFIKNEHSVKVAVPMNIDSKEGLNIEAGAEVLRFRTDQLVRNKSMIKKGIAYLKLIYQYPHAISKYYGNEKFDLIIAHSIPPEMGIIVKFLKKKYRCRFYLMLCEYIWQDSVSLGFFNKNSIICKYYQYLEKLTIKTADYIGCPSNGNIDFALSFYPWAINHNIHLLHFSQEPYILSQTNKPIRDEYGIGSDKFVVVYGGNMTIAQKIEHVVNLAEACLEYKDIIFLLLGRGTQLDYAKEESIKRQITNIKFIEFLPQIDYLNLLSVCDVGLIVLNEKLSMPNIPSKTLSYFNLSIPIVAAIDHATDYGKYLEYANAGLWSYSGDVESFKSNIIKLYSSPELRKKMGDNGYNFYMNNMQPSNAYKTIMNILNTETSKTI